MKNNKRKPMLMMKSDGSRPSSRAEDDVARE